MATSPLPSPGPNEVRKCYITPTFSGIPNKGEQNQKRLPHPCLLGGPKEGGNAMSALHSRGPSGVLRRYPERAGGGGLLRRPGAGLRRRTIPRPRQLFKEVLTKGGGTPGGRRRRI